MGHDRGSVERLVRQRRRMLTLMTIAFVLLQGSYVAASARLVEAIPVDAVRAVDVISVVGSLAWSLMLVRLMATGGRLARRTSDEVREALDDELTQANRRAAFLAGYIAMLLGACVFYIFSLFWPMDAIAAMPLFIAFGAIVPVIRFLVLDRRGERDD